MQVVFIIVQLKMRRKKKIKTKKTNIILIFLKIGGEEKKTTA